MTSSWKNLVAFISVVSWLRTLFVLILLLFTFKSPVVSMKQYFEKMVLLSSTCRLWSHDCDCATNRLRKRALRWWMVPILSRKLVIRFRKLLKRSYFLSFFVWPQDTKQEEKSAKDRGVYPKYNWEDCPWHRRAHNTSSRIAKSKICYKATEEGKDIIL